VLTPARQALADHIATLGKLAADVERAGRPVARLRQELSTALAELEAAERVLTQIDAQRASALAKAARDGAEPAAPPPSTEETEDADSQHRH
jgi:hypothetical protein